MDGIESATIFRNISFFLLVFHCQSLDGQLLEHFGGCIFMGCVDLEFQGLQEGVEGTLVRNICVHLVLVRIRCHPVIGHSCIAIPGVLWYWFAHQTGQNHRDHLVSPSPSDCIQGNLSRRE